MAWQHPAIAAALCLTGKSDRNSSLACSILFFEDVVRCLFCLIYSKLCFFFVLRFTHGHGMTLPRRYYLTFLLVDVFLAFF